MSYYSFSERQYTRTPYRVPIAKFECERCGRRWQSANGSIGDYQKCKSCYEKCYPRQIRMQEPNKKGNQNREAFATHNSELCGKCIRLGYSCIEDRDDDNHIPVVVSNVEGKDIALEKTNLLSFIVVKDKTIAKKKSDTGTIDRSGDESDKLVIKKREDISWKEFLDSGRKLKANEETSISKVSQDSENMPAVVVPDTSQLKITDDKENAKQQGIQNKSQGLAANDENPDIAVNLTSHAVDDKKNTSDDSKDVKEDSKR